VVLGLLVAGCSDGEPEERAKPERSTGEEIAASIGCAEVEVTGPHSGFQESFICKDEDRPDTTVDIFDPRNRGSVERRFSTTTLASTRPPTRGTCPDGTPELRQWFVLGDGWLAVTGDDGVKDDLVDDHDGQVLSSMAPPVTNSMDPCNQ
jgi:hypothetical protein